MINWKARFKNKTFWVSITSAVVLLSQQLGFHIFPDNIADIVNTVLLILCLMGVVVDPTTEGIGDKPKQ